MNEQWYSDFLHKHAQKWGLTVAADRPLITVERFDVEAFDGETSPYPKLTVIETLTWRDTQPHHYTEIALVTLNGLYSYTLNFQWRTRGRGYLPYLKFCDPYPTKTDALAQPSQT